MNPAHCVKITASALVIAALSGSLPATALAAGAHGPHRLTSVMSTPTFTFGREGGNIRPFTVVIAADGTVTVTGAIKVSSPSPHLSTDAPAGLLKLAKAERFFRMPRLISGSHVLPDFASLFIAIHRAGGTKTVSVHGARRPRFNQLYAVLMAAAGVSF